MAKVNKAYADRMGRKFPQDWDREQIRDFLDQGMGGELDAFQLDLMTDWAIEARAKAAA